MKVDVLGVKIDRVDMRQAVDQVVQLVAKSGKHYVVTPNPEIVMAAQQDHELLTILNSADLAVPDGIGLVWANSALHSRVAGVDLMRELCKVSAQKGFTVGLLGGAPKVAEKTAQVLKNQYPGLQVIFVYAGDGSMAGDEEIRRQMGAGIDLLFVAFGFPKQERWIARNLPYIPVKVAMAVGGSFDLIAGQKKRAPEWLQQLGLEWLWRLVREPWRWRRQLALGKFVWQVVRHIRH